MTSHEEMFRAVLFWMSRQPSTLSGTNVVVEVKKDKTSHWIKSDIGTPACYMSFHPRLANSRHHHRSLSPSDSKSSMEYLPGRGLHVIRYKGRTLWVERVQQEVTTTGWEREMTELETLTLSYIGRDASLFSQLFDDALALTEDKNHEQTHVCGLPLCGRGSDVFAIGSVRPSHARLPVLVTRSGRCTSGASGSRPTPALPALCAP